MIGTAGFNVRSRRRAAAKLLAVFILLPACAGPRQPIELTVKEFPGDVLLGRPDPELPPVTLAPAVNLEPAGFPSIIQPPPRAVSFDVSAPALPQRPPPPPPDPCPKADPLQAPEHEATRTLSAPPAGQLLRFRNDGSYEIGRPGDEKEKGDYPEESTRRILVEEDRQSDDSFVFQVEEEMEGEVTRTTYFVEPESGLYLYGIETTRDDGSTDQFVVMDPRSLPLLPLPVRPGEEFTGSGFSAASQTSMTYTGNVRDKVRVDACGTPLDAWEVALSGRIVAPNKQLDFNATYAIGTQYGGLSLRDTVELTCAGGPSVPCDNGRTVQSENTATVAAEPKRP